MFVRFLAIGKKKRGLAFPAAKQPNGVAGALTRGAGVQDRVNRSYRDEKRPIFSDGFPPLGLFSVTNVIIFSEVVHLRRIFFDLRSERTRETTPAERAASRCPCIGDGATVVARDERNILCILDNSAEVKKAAPPFPLSNATQSIADALHVPHGGTEPLRVVYSDENSRDAAAFIRFVKSLDVANVIIFSEVVHVGRYFFAFFVLRPSVASSAAVSAGANRSPCTAARFPSKR